MTVAVALLLLAGGVLMVWSGLTGVSIPTTLGQILRGGASNYHPAKVGQ